MRIASVFALALCVGCSAGDKLGEGSSAGNAGQGSGAGANGGSAAGGTGGSAAGGNGGSSAGGTGGSSATGGAGGSSASGGSSATGGTGPKPGVGVSALTECKDPNIVGATPVRRLSQLEYANAVRDLFGVMVSAADLPSDERIGDVFVTNSVSPISADQFTRYDNAAQGIADTVAQGIAAASGCTSASDAACIKTYLGKKARQAFHGVLEPADKTLIEGLYDQVAATDATLAVSTAVHFILDSTRFLFVVEFGTPEGTLSRLSPGEVAGRLASFLWRSVPDDALLAAADSGGLDDAAGIREQATRLFTDAKVQPVLKAFANEWLDLGATGTDPTSVAIDAESAAVFAALTQGNGTFGELFTTTQSRGTQDLAAFYGATLAGDGTMTLPPERGGLLTRAAFLRSHIKGALGSPTLRGKTVRGAMLCDPVTPPENVDMTVRDPMAGETPKDVFDEHAQNPNCKGCHALMDPIGYAFEAYGPTGAFDAALIGETAGVINAGNSNDFSGDFTDTAGLMDLLANGTVPRQCFAIQTARFALGRNEASADACGLKDIWTAFEAANFNLQTLFVEVATSSLMQVRNTVKPGEACR